MVEFLKKIMIKIISRVPKHTERITCGYCLAVLEYSNEDIEYSFHEYDYSEKDVRVGHITCPDCNKKHLLR